MEIPKQYRELVGKSHIFGDYIFGTNKRWPKTEFDCLDIRWGSATIWNMKDLKEKHPTFELLIKREGMRAARWTRPFPMRDIIIENENYMMNATANLKRGLKIFNYGEHSLWALNQSNADKKAKSKGWL